jgi:hypothetical protein
MRRVHHAQIHFLLPALLIALAIAGSAVATNTTRNSVQDVVGATSPVRTIFVRSLPDRVLTGAPTTWRDVPDTRARITLTRPSYILSTFTAESACSATHCYLRILIDRTEMAPRLLGNELFAFDSAQGGGPLAKQGHAMQRSSERPLPPGTYNVRPQWLVSSTGTFSLGQIHHTVEAVRAG